jgi:hypothetical protein
MLLISRFPYLIVGGAPAGMNMRPGDEGCCRNRTHIMIMTRHGNSSTRPSGTEMVESFFNLMRRLKKDIGIRGA